MSQARLLRVAASPGLPIYLRESATQRHAIRLLCSKQKPDILS